MKVGFYSRLALDGLRKNRQLTLPYLMTCSLMASVYYILFFLSRDKAVLSMRGGSSVSLVLLLGRIVILIFSAIFLFYTNSFLIRRRKKEFGLYNVLGMDKSNIARILLRETLWSYVFSMAAGLFAGIALSKLAQLFLIRLADGGVDYRFTIDWKIVLSSLRFFAVIFLLIFLNTLCQIRLSNPIELLRSESKGEKPPRARWLLGIGGAVLLAAAYWLALSIQQPLEALLWFFVAVVMVIIATYLLFITGSVVLCRLLQRNSRFYYQPRNFVSVSSMVYRMKRNGAGLASICILLTMVLVMISSSACLYFGKDGALKTRYPRSICASAVIYGYSTENDAVCDALTDFTEQAAPEGAVEPESIRNYYDYSIEGLLDGKCVKLELNSMTNQAFIRYSDIITVHILSREDYERISGTKVELGEREALMSYVMESGRKLASPGDIFSVGDQSYRIRECVDKKTLYFDETEEAGVVSTVWLVLEDRDGLARYLSQFKDYDGSDMLYLRWFYQFNSPYGPDEQDALAMDIAGGLEEILRDRGGDFRSACDCLETKRGDFFGTFGGMFFIGILLSAVFLVACVLIIYYKQISEGYEDQKRFAIMRKVGMSREDIRSSIDAQMLTVFMLPVVFAVVHLCFAFPMVEKVLVLFGVVNKRLFLCTNIIGIGAIVLFYTLVYRFTGNAYYRIVTEEE